MVRCFRYLWSSVEVEHQTLLLGDNAPHLLPRFAFLTVLQEAAYDAAARELSRLDLNGGGEETGEFIQKRSKQYPTFSTYQTTRHLQDAFLFALSYPLPGQDGEAVSADFVGFVAVVLQRHLVV